MVSLSFATATRFASSLLVDHLLLHLHGPITLRPSLLQQSGRLQLLRLHELRERPLQHSMEDTMLLIL